MWEEVFTATIGCLMAVTVFAALHPVLFSMMWGAFLGVVTRFVYLYFRREYPYET